MSGYVDLYLLPVPEGNLGRYRETATRFGAIVREHGGLNYREFRGDDLSADGAVSFTEGVPVGSEEVLTAAVVEFESRAHRDEVMQKVMQDPRVAELMKEESIANMEQMRYGGFETIVTA